MVGEIVIRSEHKDIIFPIKMEENENSDDLIQKVMILKGNEKNIGRKPLEIDLEKLNDRQCVLANGRYSSLIFFTGNPFLINRNDWEILKLGCDLSGPKLVNEPRCQLMRNGQSCLDGQNRFSGSSKNSGNSEDSDNSKNSESSNEDSDKQNTESIFDENYSDETDFEPYAAPDSNEYESSEDNSDSKSSINSEQESDDFEIIDDENPVSTAQQISWRKVLIVTLIALCIAIFVIVMLMVFSKTRRMLFMTKGGSDPPNNGRLDDTLVQTQPELQRL